MLKSSINNILIDIRETLYKIYFTYKDKLTFFQYDDGSILLMVNCEIETFIEDNEKEVYASSSCYLLIDYDYISSIDLNAINQSFSYILDIGKDADGVDVNKSIHRKANSNDMDIIFKKIKHVFNLAIESEDYKEDYINKNFLDSYKRLYSCFDLE